ncbi:MAG: hypothetical protein JKX99_00205 [Robiginitomaculum sp.]|nr:hypothetical protein [Robiginitomaculum sp.]
MQNAGQTTGTTDYRPPAPHPGQNQGWERVRALSVLDLIGLVWRQLPLMILVFIVICGLGFIGVMGLKKEYTAEGRILVKFGEEYIYNPVFGTAGQGTAFTTDQMIQAEVGFFTAAILKERVLHKLGLRQIYPALAAKYQSNPGDRVQITGQTIQNLSNNLGAFTAPNQPLISVTFRHENPETAAQILTSFISEYQTYRREILLNSGNTHYGIERQSTEEKLDETYTTLAKFLNSNQIGDFLAERTAAGVRYAALNDQLLTARARQQEIAAGIRAREERLTTIPQEILQFTDDSSSGELASLQIQREQLLARYQPTSKPVRAIDTQITRLENFITEGRNKNLGIKRTGINLVYQTLQSEKFTLEAEAESISERITVLSAQLAQVRTKQTKMQRLFPEFQRLDSKAAVLQAAAQQFSAREEEYQARQNLTEQASNNIQVIEPPIIPFQGKSLKKLAAIMTVMFAGFTALMLGLGLELVKIAKATSRSGAPTRAANPAPQPMTFHAANGPARAYPTATQHPAYATGPGGLPILANIGPNSRQR